MLSEYTIIMEFHSGVKFDNLNENQKDKIFKYLGLFCLFAISVFLLSVPQPIQMELQADYNGQEEPVDLYSGMVEEFSVIHYLLADRNCDRFINGEREGWEFDCEYSGLVNPFSNFPYHPI